MPCRTAGLWKNLKTGKNDGRINSGFLACATKRDFTAKKKTCEKTKVFSCVLFLSLRRYFSVCFPGPFQKQLIIDLVLIRIALCKGYHGVREDFSFSKIPCNRIPFSGFGVRVSKCSGADSRIAVQVVGTDIFQIDGTLECISGVWNVLQLSVDPVKFFPWDFGIPQRTAQRHPSGEAGYTLRLESAGHAGLFCQLA